MIVWLNSLFSIFNKPEILWSKADQFQALLCYAICIGGVAIIGAVIFAVVWIIVKIKNRRK